MSFLKEPYAGWSAICFGDDYVGPLSYIDDVPAMLCKLIHDYQQEKSACVCFDTEGWNWTLILSDYEVNILTHKDRTELIHTQINPEIFCQAIMQELREQEHLWVEWYCPINKEETESVKEQLHQLLYPNEGWEFRSKKHSNNELCFNIDIKRTKQAIHEIYFKDNTSKLYELSLMSGKVIAYENETYCQLEENQNIIKEIQRAGLQAFINLDIKPRWHNFKYKGQRISNYANTDINLILNDGEIYIHSYKLNWNALVPIDFLYELYKANIISVDTTPVISGFSLENEIIYQLAYRPKTLNKEKINEDKI